MSMTALQPPTPINRWLTDLIQSRRQVRRIISLVGARQSGKTTLAQHMSGPEVEYRTLETEHTQQWAESDPEGFLAHDQQMLIIDEVQRVPRLVRHVKVAVDDDNRPGRFMLTGSADVTRLPQVAESLAGRVSQLRLRPLTQGELLSTKPSFVERCFAQDFAGGTAEYTQDDIMELAMRGGFPETIELDNHERLEWHRDYSNTILERDLLEIANLRRHDAVKDLLNTVAAWSARPVNLSKIGQRLSLTHPTINTYLNHLALLFLVDLVPAWAKTETGKVGKRPKLLLTDSGLMASLQGLNHAKLRQSPELSGPLLETFAYAELAAQIDATGKWHSNYHYYYNSQRELDFLLEDHEGALVGIEVKANPGFNKSAVRHLAWFRDNIAGTRPFVGVVLYTGKQLMRLSGNLWVVPFEELWSDR